MWPGHDRTALLLLRPVFSNPEVVTGSIAEAVRPAPRYLRETALPPGFTLVLMIPGGLKQCVHDLLGPRGYLDRPEDLALYEYDGGIDKHAPDLVAFPRSTEIGRAHV